MITNETTLAELRAELIARKVLRVQMVMAPHTTVVLLVKEDGSTALSAGHETIAAAVAEVIARMDES